LSKSDVQLDETRHADAWASYCPLCRRRYNEEDLEFCHRDGARLRPGSELGSRWLGTVIDGKYRLLRLLGAGGMAEVYEAERVVAGGDDGPDRVAVKILRPQVASDPAMLERFRREARLICLIDHPNVIRVYDFGALDSGSLYMTMELLLGDTLEEVIEAGPLDPATALDIARQACDGLQAAHDKQVIHRDIKPANLFLEQGRDGGGPAGSTAQALTVKILDLGIAKIEGENAESNLTVTGFVIGTPEYMAPEQALARPLDPRSDVYALGIVLFRLFTGTVPFKADSYVALLTKHVSEAPVWPVELARRCAAPPGIEKVILKAIAKNPDLRYQSIHDLRAALDLIAPSAVASRPSSPPTPPAAATTGGRRRSMRRISLAEARAGQATVTALSLRAGSDRDVVEVAPDVFWVGRREGVQLERNTYLRVFRGDGLQINLLVDPGPPKDLAAVADKVGAIIGSLERVDLLFLNHEDPDVSANAATIQELSPHAHVLCSEDTWRLAQFYGLKPGSYSAIEHFKDRRTRLATGHVLTFVPTPYCHARGAVMCYDEAARVLFSGDLLGGLSLRPGLVADEAAWSGVEVFHQLYMPSGLALRRAMASVRRLTPPPLLIAPQHGALIEEDRIETGIALVEQLVVGVDLAGPDSTGGRSEVERAITAINEIVEGLVGLLGAQRASEELRCFSSDGTFPNLFLFEGEHRIAGIKIDPRAALRALLGHLRAECPESARAPLEAIVEAALARGSLRVPPATDPYLDRAIDPAR
jgi:eukaryotic-like serine/threonine-protein kinase